MNPSSTLLETFFLLLILPFPTVISCSLTSYRVPRLSFQPEGDLCMFFTQVQQPPQFLPHIYFSFFSLSLSLSLLSFSLSTLFLSVHSCTHTQISSDALSADYSLFIEKKKISYDKLWYNVICFAIFCEPTLYK